HAPRYGVESCGCQRRTDWKSHPSCRFPWDRPAVDQARSRTGESKLMIQLVVRTFSSLQSHEEGQTVIEYALIMALVSIAAIGLLSAIGDFPFGVFREVNADF